MNSVVRICMAKGQSRDQAYNATAVEHLNERQSLLTKLTRQGRDSVKVRFILVTICSRPS